MKNIFIFIFILCAMNNAFAQTPLTIKNQLIIDSEGNGSGLQFTGINSSTTSTITPNTLLTLDAQGNVIVGQMPVIPSGANIWTLSSSTASTSATSVVIGTGVNIPANNPYSLYVSKGILTEKIRVSVLNSSFWADYVFDTNYKLLPLNKVEEFINMYKHLPEVPSADEVSKNGIDFVEMQATLLRKIEELTLYMIQQQKTINKLKKESQRRKRK